MSENGEAINSAADFIADGNESRPLQEQPTSPTTAFAIEVQQSSLNQTRDIAKRIMDLLIGTCLLVLLSPILILAAIIIKMDSPGPVLFFQERGGLHGKVFWIAKFRTMSVMENKGDVEQAVVDDPRITRIGKWLRNTCIDELPQLFNVLAGQMSLVGPRPHALGHDVFFAKLVDNYAMRQRLKPGMTGWAQVNGLRGPASNSDKLYRRIEHDLWYIEHANVFLDMTILVATVPIVFPIVFGSRNAL